MIPAECCEACTHSLVKVAEHGKKLVVHNASQLEYVKIRYDGCVIKGAVSADFVVRCPEGDIIVELKGVDVNHGSQQVMQTAMHFRASTKSTGPFAAIIVARQYPKITTTIQRAKLAFAREFKGPLHVVTKNGVFDASRILDFKGPH